jgi:shikimate dehydrogenase
VVGLLEAGIDRIALANRSRERAVMLVANVAPEAPIAVIALAGHELDEACAVADLIVNTTPLGTAHTASASDSPLAAGHFRRGVYAYDLVYNPPETPFLALAREAGALTVSGLDMLVYQGAESLRLFTGRKAPVDIMREAARAALGLV